MDTWREHEAGRKSLPHDPPQSVDTAGATFFVTICCEPKGVNQLCHKEIAENIFATARYYAQLRYWRISILLLMPDHLHMLASFGREHGMTKTIRQWKRYIAAQYKIRWQRDFFDHRLRSDE